MSYIIISSVKIVYHLQLQEITIILHLSRGVTCHFLAPLNGRTGCGTSWLRWDDYFNFDKIMVMVMTTIVMIYFKSTFVYVYDNFLLIFNIEICGCYTVIYDLNYLLSVEFSRFVQKFIFFNKYWAMDSGGPLLFDT